MNALRACSCMLQWTTYFAMYAVFACELQLIWSRVSMLLVLHSMLELALCIVADSATHNAPVMKCFAQLMAHRFQLVVQSFEWRSNRRGGNGVLEKKATSTTQATWLVDS